MNAKTSRLLTAALGAGALGFCLRTILYRVGFDDKHIISSCHPLHLACLGLTALLAVYLLLAIRRDHGAVIFQDTPLRSMASLAAACLMGYHGLSLRHDMAGLLEIARMALALSSAACMAICALPGMLRRSIYGVFLGIISIFFAVDMLCRYQNWSGNPQLPDYTLQVLASVLLALCSYHRLAFCTGLGKRRALMLCCLPGLALCLMCAAGPETRGFYLGGAFWAGACICSTLPPEEADPHVSA